MSRDIAERDWKVFKELHSIAMDRFFERTVKQIQPMLWTKDKPAQQRFWDAVEFATKQKKQAEGLFDDYRRSTAVIQAGIIYAKGFLTEEEVGRFSSEMQTSVKAFAQPPFST